MIDEIGEALRDRAPLPIVTLGQSMRNAGVAAQQATNAFQVFAETFENIATLNRPGLDVTYTITWEEA